MTGLGTYCGCAGCSSNAEAVVEHPDHGERMVCGAHAQQFEVVAYV